MLFLDAEMITDQNPPEAFSLFNAAAELFEQAIAFGINDSDVHTKYAIVSSPFSDNDGFFPMYNSPFSVNRLITG